MEAELIDFWHISYLCSLSRRKTMINNTKQTPPFFMHVLVEHLETASVSEQLYILGCQNG